MYTIKKYWPQAMMLMVILVGLWSCTGMDEGYKEFIKDGEISYTGKIDSLHIYAGKTELM